MIEVKGVSKDFDGARVIDPVSFDVPRGDSLAIIGPSGCGKTTLLYIMAGMVTPTEGSVTISGERVVGTRRDVAFILQDFGLLPWRTVRQNVSLGLRIRGEEDDDLVDRLIDDLGLATRADDYPSTLSGGEKQRTAIARSLALDPGLLLMDEPFSALDTLTRERLQDQVLEIWSRTGRTMVFVTHSIEEAVFLGRRVMVLGGKPCSIRAMIDNPSAGGPGYRSDERYFEVCKAVRGAVEG